MTTGAGYKGSIWLDEPLPDTPPLSRDATCDVCVVGGGIAGLLVADRLTREGQRVVLLDQGRLCGGETGRTTAHFTSALDDRFSNLERMHGQGGARMAAESHAAAVDYVESLVNELGVDCGWTRLDGYLVVSEQHAAKREELLQEEMDAVGRAGLKVDRVPALPLPWPLWMGPALRFPRQAQAHPLRLLRAVAARLIDSGARLHSGTHATEIHQGPQARVETRDGRTVHCSHVVVATNTPINNLVAVHTKQSGYQTYVLGFRVPAGALPRALVWDGLWEHDHSYHYVRVLEGTNGSDLLIVGGEDHKTGQGPEGDKPYACLEDWTRRVLPVAGDVQRRWSGEVMEPADGIGYIGRDAAHRKNVYVVTGDSGNGMTHGAIAAMLIPDLILGRENRWEKLYHPSRKIGLHALREYASENVNTLAQYGDWLKKGDVTEESQIGPGQGAVMVSGLKRLAVYREESGECVRLNATCPHLGGVVRWNEVEKTWDCPCHASRFDRYGKMMHGPANSDLSVEK